jgi:hypothetical protein
VYYYLDATPLTRLFPSTLTIPYHKFILHRYGTQAFSES